MDNFDKDRQEFLVIAKFLREEMKKSSDENIARKLHDIYELGIENGRNDSETDRV